MTIKNNKRKNIEERKEEMNMDNELLNSGGDNLWDDKKEDFIMEEKKEDLNIENKKENINLEDKKEQINVEEKKDNMNEQRKKEELNLERKKEGSKIEEKEKEKFSEEKKEEDKTEITKEEIKLEVIKEKGKKEVPKEEIKKDGVNENKEEKKEDNNIEGEKKDEKEATVINEKKKGEEEKKEKEKEMKDGFLNGINIDNKWMISEEQKNISDFNISLQSYENESEEEIKLRKILNSLIIMGGYSNIISIGQKYVNSGAFFYVSVYCEFKCNFILDAKLYDNYALRENKIYALSMIPDDVIKITFRSRYNYNILKVNCISSKMKPFQIFMAKKDPSSSNSFNSNPIFLNGYYFSIKKGDINYASQEIYEVLIENKEYKQDLLFWISL